MAKPTKRMMHMGEMAHRRYIEVLREERIRTHGKPLKGPYDGFADLPEHNQFGWAEAALVAFKTGVHAMKLQKKEEWMATLIDTMMEQSVDTLHKLISVKSMTVAERPKAAFFVAERLVPDPENEGRIKDRELEIFSYVNMESLSQKTQCLVRAEFQLGIRADVTWDYGETFREGSKPPWSDKWECEAITPDGRTIRVVLHHSNDDAGNRYHLTLVDPSKDTEALTPGATFSLVDETGRFAAIARIPESK